jgi:hypothetical protein
MSSANGAGEETVKNDEGLVDRKTKEQILGLRQQVDEDERTLYINRMSDPEYTVTIEEANQYWGISVRQYLRGIKRLWSEDTDAKIRNVEQYWQEQVIGTETLVPPDTRGYQFSLVAYSDISTGELRKHLGLPRGAELPEPQVKTFKGLHSVLSTNRIEHTWVVKTDTSGPPPRHETVQLQVAEPIPKHILENAVEAADNFLQQAGLGFEVGDKLATDDI